MQHSSQVSHLLSFVKCEVRSVLAIVTGHTLHVGHEITREKTLCRREMRPENEQVCQKYGDLQFCSLARTCHSTDCWHVVDSRLLLQLRQSCHFRNLDV